MAGRPLAPDVASDLGHRLGADLSAVRVHTDDHAAASALQLGAAAYTVGSDIVFAHGRYAPHTDAGQRLLAHELAHVMQLRGPVGNGPGGGDHEGAADRVAHAALAGLPLPAHHTGPGPAVRMQAKPDPFDALRAGKPLTGSQAADMLRHYETLPAAERDTVVRAFARVGFADSPLRRWLAALPVGSLRGSRDVLTDIGERVQRLAVEQTSGKTLAQLGAAQAAFLLPAAEKDARAQVDEEAKKAGVPPPATVSDADVAKAHAEATEKASPVRPPEAKNAWDRVKETPGEEAKWHARAAKAIAAVVVACHKVAPELGIVAANLKWAPDKIAERGRNVFAMSGDPLTIGMSFVETAEADPEYVVSVVVHEIAGHPEFGLGINSFEAKIFAEAHRQVPRLGATWTYGSRHTYGYIGTEIYSALREVPYFRSLSLADSAKGLIRSIPPDENVANKIGLVAKLFPPEIGKAVVQGLYERFRTDPRISEAALALFEATVDKQFPSTLKGVPRRGPTWTVGLGAGVGGERAGGRNQLYTEVEANAVLRFTTTALSFGARLELLPTEDKGTFVRAGLQSQLHVQLFRNLYGDLRGGYLWGFKGASSGATVGGGLSYDFGPVQMGLLYDFLKVANKEDPNAHRLLIRAGMNF
ncbi:DUF4157 domain-containing protein [Actinoplanes sp. NPDC051861]|uniref:eCIS core domain-containing protein n=1 Tax=Actinoplanes sp. NPDC051861 TaxID=3155170 RepID=UPI0034437548